MMMVTTLSVVVRRAHAPWRPGGEPRKEQQQQRQKPLLLLLPSQLLLQTPGVSSPLPRGAAGA